MDHKLFRWPPYRCVTLEDYKAKLKRLEDLGKDMKRQIEESETRPDDLIDLYADTFDDWCLLRDEMRFHFGNEVLIDEDV